MYIMDEAKSFNGHWILNSLWMAKGRLWGSASLPKAFLLFPPGTPGLPWDPAQGAIEVGAIEQFKGDTGLSLNPTLQK